MEMTQIRGRRTSPLPLRWWHWLAGSLALALSAAALAHALPPQSGTLRLEGESAWLVLSVPATALPGIDADGDGKLALDELRAKRAAIEAQLRAGLQLLDPDGPRPMTVTLLPLVQQQESAAAPEDHLAIAARYALARPVKGSDDGSNIGSDGDSNGGAAPQLRLRSTLFASSDPTATLRISASVGARLQLITLSPERDEQALFPSRLAVLREFIVMGLEHILFGADHLLFLWVLLSTRIGLRRWLYLLSAFTLAHAATYTMASLGWIMIPASVVEPLIAATIMGIAWLQFRGTQLRLAQEVGLVLAFGLVHGMGFASAMQGLAVDGSYPVLGILGFNLGIEGGQLLVALLLWLLARAAQRLPAPAPALDWARYSSAAAGMVGTFWLVQRIAG